MKDPLATVVISTYNRRDALLATLDRLAHQTVSPQDYEVIVVDDGSTDRTSEALATTATPYELRVFRHESNRGISAGRNLGIRNARGRYIVFLSDDLLVPEDFIAVHTSLLAEHTDSWIVGGLRQLESATDGPFGRYLDLLERGFEEERKLQQLGPHLWQLEWPTARNLSLPRADLERLGLFDERFRTSCEDQDLAQRAMAIGIRFLYTDAIDCVHNDQAAQLSSYCKLQVPRIADTVLFCRKYPDVHGGAPVAVENGPLTRDDPPRRALKKVVKSALARPVLLAGMRRLVEGLERMKIPDRVLFRLYRVLIGLHMFRGWRDGLRAGP